MRIVYISSEYPPLTGNGGIGTYTKCIAEGMCRRGHEVHVISQSRSGERFEEKVNGVTIHRVPSVPFMLPQGRSFYYLRILLRWMFFHTLVRLSWASAAARELNFLNTIHKKFDIVEYPECGAEGFFIKKISGTLTVVRLHTPWYVVRSLNTINEQPGDHLLFKMLEIHAIKRADLITAPSAAVASLVLKSPDKSKPFIVPNPVDTSRGTLHSGKNWIFTGRVERRKGVHILLDAYFNVCRTYNPPELIILGAPFGTDKDGISYESKTYHKIQSSSFSKKVIWIKGVAQNEVQKYLQQSVAAFYPSLWENFSYACLEAMAAGCAVVASDCGGFKEMISNGVNGILIEPGNVRKWSDVMISFLNTPEITVKLGDAASAHLLKNYNLETICIKNEHYFLEKVTGRLNG
ncbi:MAG: glycosyltransferase family 4 protein [Chitinispirillaceae bacterium]|nr:glycosyltransferase family 4 protein [Chitinispirillaceae bacterium]